MLLSVYYAVPNDIHQADLLFLPGDKYKGKKYKYALCVVTCMPAVFKAAYPLTSKQAKEVSTATNKQTS